MIKNPEKPKPGDAKKEPEKPKPGDDKEPEKPKPGDDKEPSSQNHQYHMIKLLYPQ